MYLSKSESEIKTLLKYWVIVEWKNLIYNSLHHKLVFLRYINIKINAKYISNEFE